MNYQYYDFRNALVILRSRASFGELESALHSIEAEHVLGAYSAMSEARAGRRSRPPAGGQGALNRVIDDLLSRAGWESQPPLFRDRTLEKWKMDFRKEGIGVEVSFNHAEAIPWQFTRLNIAGESDRVLEDNRIDVWRCRVCRSEPQSMGADGQCRRYLRPIQGVAPRDAADPAGSASTYRPRNGWLAGWDVPRN